jgi:enoyl-CoA hydratase/carnithine racemase
MSDRVLRQDANGLCTLTLNRPDKLNALDTETFKALDSHLAAIEQDDSIGCVLLRAAGRAFCAGADLNALDGALATLPPSFKPGVVERLARLPKPVVAGVHGICFTGGVELVLAADFIVAEASARFADTHGKWGFVGAWGITQRLPRRIGIAAAKRMMMTARVVEAPEALAMGLIDIMAPEGELDAVMAEFMGQILANSWHTNFATKRLMLETDGMSLSEGLAHESYRYPGLAPDYKERIARFTKKG